MAQDHFERGVEAARGGRREEAIEAYRRAIAQRPEFFEALANLGNLLQLSGRHAEAIPLYRRALALRPGVVPVLNGLGLCELATGSPREAVASFERTLALEPGFASAHNNLGNALARLNETDRAIEHLRQAVRLRPDFTLAWVNLGEQLYRKRDDAQALAALDQALGLEPGNDSVRYLRDAIAGVQVERAPDAYVREFFDRFAAEFDARLTGDLEYRTPEAFSRFLAPVLQGRQALRIADLGCGTGLSGVALRPFASRLVGVDLSGAMLERARGRAVYDELVQSEITAYLLGVPAGSLDLVTAVDVFVYVGALAPAMQAAWQALAPGGALAFSVEDLEDSGPAGYRLARTGRYAHARAHVEQLARAQGFAVGASEAATIRKEAGVPVAGRLFALLKS